MTLENSAERVVVKFVAKICGSVGKAGRSGIVFKDIWRILFPDVLFEHPEPTKPSRPDQRLSLRTFSRNSRKLPEEAIKVIIPKIDTSDKFGRRQVGLVLNAVHLLNVDKVQGTSNTERHQDSSEPRGLSSWSTSEQLKRTSTGPSAKERPSTDWTGTFNFKRLLDFGRGNPEPLLDT